MDACLGAEFGSAAHLEMLRLGGGGTPLDDVTWDVSQGSCFMAPTFALQGGTAANAFVNFGGHIRDSFGLLLQESLGESSAGLGFDRSG